jgi:hypothetical protein
LSELKESIVSQKGLAQQTGANPYASSNQPNYNPWKDENIADSDKVQMLIRNIRSGKLD